MPQRIIQIITEKKFEDIIDGMIKQIDLDDAWRVTDTDNEAERITYAMLMPLEKTQEVLDLLQTTFVGKETTRILVLPIEASLPKKPEPEKEKTETEAIQFGERGVSREELYEDVSDGTKLTGNFILLILLSTIVAAIGLLKNNPVVLIGAMVIAPLLSPNLALAFSIAIGDLRLAWKAIKTNLIGIILALELAYIIALFWTHGFNSQELLARTHVGFDSLMLAFASGAAGVLSLTAGLSSVLVGVMVSVALLLPVATIGIMLGAKLYHLAFGATLLFAVNVVALNLSANLIFLLKGIYPTRWHEKKKAKLASFWHILFLIILLIILTSIIYIRGVN